MNLLNWFKRCRPAPKPDAEALCVADHRATFARHYPDVRLDDREGAEEHASGAFFLAALDGKLTTQK